MIILNNYYFSTIHWMNFLSEKQENCFINNKKKKENKTKMFFRTFDFFFKNSKRKGTGFRSIKGKIVAFFSFFNLRPFQIMEGKLFMY
jgi:hypothetical protein